MSRLTKILAGVILASVLVTAILFASDKLPASAATQPPAITLSLSTNRTTPAIGTEVSVTLWLTNNSTHPLVNIVHTLDLTSEVPTPLSEKFPQRYTLPISVSAGQSATTPIIMHLVSTGVMTLSDVVAFDIQVTDGISTPGEITATPLTLTIPATDVLTVVLYQALYRAICYVDFLESWPQPPELSVTIGADVVSAFCYVSAGHNMYWRIERFADSAAALAAFDQARGDAPLQFDACVASYRWQRTDGSPLEQTEFGWVSDRYLLQAGSFDDTPYIQAPDAAAALKRVATDDGLLPSCLHSYLPQIVRN